MHPCPKCGNQVPDDQAFCRNCGAPQMPATASPQTQSPDWELGATIVGKNFPLTPPVRPSTPPPAKPPTTVAPPSTPVTLPVTPAPMTPPNTSAPNSPQKSRKGLLIGAGVLIVGFIALIIILIIVLTILANR